MKRTLVLAAGALALLFCTTAFAQPTYPSNGYVGVFQDAAATQCCMTAPAFTPTTLHIVAVLGGALSSGMTGAEFRLVFEPAIDPSKYSISFSASPTAAVIIGSPICNACADPNTFGLNIAWADCQGAAAGDKVEIGTLTVINLVAPPGTAPGMAISVRRKSPPNTAQFDCPLMVDCNRPEYNIWCLTLQTSELPSEPIIFNSSLNLPCDAPTCGVVAVAEKTWSSVKGLYR
jgi:hypothetical protein